MNKIYVFHGMENPYQEGWAYAIADDGRVVETHYCSNESFAAMDLGARPGSFQKSRHEDYAKEFPDGFEVEFVPCSERDTHEGLQKALKLNKEQQADEFRR